jgi:hypothetical protein
MFSLADQLGEDRPKSHVEFVGTIDGAYFTYLLIIGQAALTSRYCAARTAKLCRKLDVLTE